MDFETYKVYPRVYYFQRRVDDLYERFKRVIGQFRDDYQDKMWLSDIQAWIEKLKSPPGFNKTCGHDGLNFGVKDVIVKHVTEKPESTSIPRKENLQIYVFYDKLDDFNEETKQNTVDEMLKFVEETTREDYENIDTCFALVDIPSQEPAESIAQFRDSIIELLSERFSEHNWGDRVVIGPDQVSLSKKISAALETLVMAVFKKMYDYLDRFLQQHPKFVRHDFKMTEVSGLEETVADFVNCLLPLMDTRIHMSEKEFEEIATERFAKQTKMLVSKPMVQKYNLKDSVCRTLLEEVEFEEKVKASLMKSENCKTHLNDLDKQTEKQYYEEHMEMLKDIKGAPKPSYKNNYMIKDFLECLKGPLEEIERAVIEKEKVLNVMQKMKFEISGYFKQSIVEDVTQEKNPVQLTDSLIKAIKSLNEEGCDSPIYGCGVIYGTLQILVLDLSKDTKEKIALTLKQHNFWYPYKVTLVKQKPVDLADGDVGTGEQILAIWRPDTNRRGTLGGFAVNNNGDKYGVTCAHVVSLSDQPAEYVYIERNDRTQYLGSGNIDTMIMNGAFDFAAVKVERNQGNICEQFKDDNGSPKPSVLFQSSPLGAIQTFPYVYKFGATSGLTKGSMASFEVNVFSNSMFDYDCYLLIEQQPDFDPSQPKFATEGDSGSIVCTPDIDDPDRIIVLAMVRSGGMHLGDNGQEQIIRNEPRLENYTITFMLLRGVQALSAQTNNKVNLIFQ